MTQSASKNGMRNATFDLLKLIMALLVVGIHTEPFGFNIWLDRGFGIITRLCVPFFFTTSAFFYWKSEKSPLHYLKRVFTLYFVWSLIYLPFDIKTLSQMNITSILIRYFWSGNEHALWYLCGSIVAFILTYLLLKVFQPKYVFVLSCVFLLIGCLKSTWAPLLERLFSITPCNLLGSRNGLFYGFPYMALGMLIAKNKNTENNINRYIIGFLGSLFALSVESIIFVVFLHTSSTILWISVLPCTYYLFMTATKISIKLEAKTSLFIRKTSTISYVSQYLFIPLYGNLKSFYLFFAVVISTVLLSIVIITLSNTKFFRWIRILY